MAARELVSGKLALLTAAGVGAWAAAVGVIRFGGAAHLFDGTWLTAVLFLLTLLGSHAVLWTCLRFAQVEEEDALAAGAVISSAALMLHGVALTWAPALYGPDPEIVRLGSAWLLWGVGATLVMAWLRTRAAPA